MTSSTVITERDAATGLDKTALVGRRSPHAAFLDGLRGIAAIYVVLYHLWLHPFPKLTSEAAWLRKIPGLWMSFGHYAVVLFIVLSGFSLMMPVATRGGILQGGFRLFFERRAWRILPPYFASFTVYLTAIAIFPKIAPSPYVGWPADGWHSIGSVVLPHIFLIHNFRPDWIYLGNVSAWTIATE